MNATRRQQPTLNASHGAPTGTAGTVTFDGMATPKRAVLDPEGRIWVQTVNPHLWLPTNARPEQFTEATS